MLGGGVIDPVTERSKKALGRLVGDYILTPVFQLSESQRVAGIRTRQAKYADYSSDDPYTFTFDESPMIAEMYRVLAQVYGCTFI